MLDETNEKVVIPVDELFDFTDEEPTSPDRVTMDELMQSMSEFSNEINCPGIPTATSDRPTRPVRPMVKWRDGLEDVDG